MREYVFYSLTSLAAQKSRTALTLLSMVIGVAVIIAMVSIGEGMQSSVSEQLKKVGAEVISVFPSGFQFGPGAPPVQTVPFQESELKEIERIAGVKAVAPALIKAGVVEYKSEKKTISVRGTTKNGLEKIFSRIYSVKEGRIFEDYEEGVVLGAQVAKNIFSKEVRVGDTIKINEKNLKVVGIFRESGNNQRDSLIVMPLSQAQRLFDAEREITGIMVLSESEKVVEQVAKKIEDTLKKLRGGKDFEVITSRQLAEQVGRITTIISFVLGGIASVSIIVGGVIIMNTMLMGVIERTREIGVMKATGATNANILLLFLVESALVGLAGGAIGIVMGAGISLLIEYAGRIYIGGSFTTVITRQMVVGALLFSLLVGSFSGVYPAYRASKLDPVEALRYE